MDITNDGTLSSGSAKVAYYINSSPNLTGATYIGNDSFSSLSPSSSDNENITYSIPGNLVGDYYFIADVDYLDEISESSESNNLVAIGPIEITEPISDATIRNFTIPGFQVYRDRTYDFTVRIRNDGDTTRTFWVGLSFSLLRDDGMPFSYPENWYDPLPIESVELVPGEETDVTFDVALPKWLPSGDWNYTTAVWHDFDEGNNQMQADPDSNDGTPYDRFTGSAFTLLDAPEVEDPYDIAEYDIQGGLYHEILPQLRNNLADLGAFANPNHAMRSAIDGAPIDTSSRNLVIIFHGWNKRSLNHDVFEGGWDRLIANWQQIDASKRGSWDLVSVDWRRDAFFPLDSAIETDWHVAAAAAAASSVGYQHGLMASKNLIEQTNGQVDNIIIIGHSAGSWAVLSAAGSLHSNLPSSSNIQVVLLDPFIPGKAGWTNEHWFNFLNDAALSSVIDSTRTPHGIAGAQAYHKVDPTDLRYHFTTPEWTWEAGGLVTDLSDLTYENPHDSGGHSIPVDFYGDSMTTPHGANMQLPGIGSVGWAQSIFEMLSAPAAPANLSPADNSEFTTDSPLLKLDWLDSNDASSYDIFIGEDDSFILPKVATVFSSEWELTSTLDVGTYYWKVVANNASGSTPSETSSFDIVLPIRSISLSSDPSGVGALTGDGDFHLGARRTVTASDPLDYDFFRWTEHGALVSFDQSYTFDLFENRNLVAEYVIENRTISLFANPPEGGSTNGQGDFSIGSDRTLEAIPSPLHDFIGWHDGDTFVSTDPEYEITISDNQNFTAFFRPQAETRIFTMLGNASEGLTLQWGVRPDYKYWVQRKFNLLAPDWLNVDLGRTYSPEQESDSFVIPMTGNSGFYRMYVLPDGD